MKTKNVRTDGMKEAKYLARNRQGLRPTFTQPEKCSRCEQKCKHDSTPCCTDTLRLIERYSFENSRHSFGRHTSSEPIACDQKHAEKQVDGHSMQ